jgi:hypothetical protein
VGATLNGASADNAAAVKAPLQLKVEVAFKIRGMAR